MGQYTIDYGTHGPKIVAAFKRAYNYQEFLEDEVTPNPESAADMTKRKVEEYVRGIVDVYSDAVAGADDTAQATKDADRAENSEITVS